MTTMPHFQPCSAVSISILKEPTVGKKKENHHLLSSCPLPTGTDLPFSNITYFLLTANISVPILDHSYLLYICVFCVVPRLKRIQFRVIFMSERKEMADYLIHVVNKYWWGSSRKSFVLNAGRLCWGVDWSLGLWSSGLVWQELPGTFLVPTCLAI